MSNLGYRPIMHAAPHQMQIVSKPRNQPNIDFLPSRLLVTLYSPISKRDELQVETPLQLRPSDLVIIESFLAASSRHLHSGFHQRKVALHRCFHAVEPMPKIIYATTHVAARKWYGSSMLTQNKQVVAGVDSQASKVSSQRHS